MPWIIDYQTAFERLSADGLQCHYFNSGAFGFPTEAGAAVRGWVLAEDVTIKPPMRSLAQVLTPPTEARLAEMFCSIWQTHLPGPVWLLPKSNWSYELNYGSKDWMPAALEAAEIDPGLLSSRNDAAALEFSAGESQSACRFIRRLLEMLLGSDFTAAFPRRKMVCTIHHHKQLWWMTPEIAWVEGLDEFSGKSGGSSRGANEAMEERPIDREA